MQCVSGTTTCHIVCNGCSRSTVIPRSTHVDSCENCNANKVTRFWQFDVEQQVRLMIEAGNLLNNVIFPADRLVNIEELGLHYANSELYKEFMDSIPLDNRTDLSYSLCSNGFALCTTANLEVCPVYISIKL